MAGLKLISGMFFLSMVVGFGCKSGDADKPDAPNRQLATGVVFHDTDGDGQFDPDEEGIAGVRVSNGTEIVLTNAEGEYALPFEKPTTFFIIKPQGWRTAMNVDHIPEFYYIHMPDGSPEFKYDGIAPTGPLPASIDFPLYEQDEPELFQAVIFADTQPRDQKEIDYIAHDVVEELVGIDASFGVTLGDVMYDDLSLFRSLNQTIGLIGIPWYNVVGNHDINFDSPDDYWSNTTFMSVYGPPYYSFDYGKVHFIVLDDVEWIGRTEESKGRYVGGLGEEQMLFIKNDLSLVPEEQLVVLFMHIPLTDVGNRQELYRLIENRPFTLSVSGHTHYQEHRFISGNDGWQGRQPHHHVVNVTVSGSWWRGALDERGIPHTMMKDGAPNGYSLITFDGHTYDIAFKGASMPADYQMSIWLPEEMGMAEADTTKVSANIFGGSERSIVEFNVNAGPWAPMVKVLLQDPYFLALKALEESPTPPTGLKLPDPRDSGHIWEAVLPAKLEPGMHLLTVRATDMFGKVYTGCRSFRVAQAAAKTDSSSR